MMLLPRQRSQQISVAIGEAMQSMQSGTLNVLQASEKIHAFKAVAEEEHLKYP
jgi:hypothetical protein